MQAIKQINALNKQTSFLLTNTFSQFHCYYSYCSWALEGSIPESHIWCLFFTLLMIWNLQHMLDSIKTKTTWHITAVLSVRCSQWRQPPFLAQVHECVGSCLMPGDLSVFNLCLSAHVNTRSCCSLVNSPPASTHSLFPVKQ